MKIVSVSEMRRWEGLTIESGTSVADLMRDAVNGCRDWIVQNFSKRPVWIFCGKGNNGNDGLLLAYELQKLGWPIKVILTHKMDQRVPHPFPTLVDEVENVEVWPKVSFDGTCCLVVDGLLGLGGEGFSKGVTRDVLKWIREKRRSDITYISLDLPSGLNEEMGAADECTFQADFTLGLGAIKDCCLRDAVLPFTGKVVGIPICLNESIQVDSRAVFFTTRDAGEIVRKVRPNAHKYTQGRVHVWAGSAKMPGAAMLVTRAALRAGAGLVKLYAEPIVCELAVLHTPEILLQPIESGGDLPPDFLQADAFVIGPGLGRDEKTEVIFKKLLPKLEYPTVLDADALYFLSKITGFEVPEPFVLTPHTGEMGRLLGHDVLERVEAAMEWVKRNRGALVLKGAHSLISQNGLPTSYNSTGNAGMASAGMGDVLAGVIGGLLAQGYSSFDAARLGTFLHGLAADVVVRKSGFQSLIASDVVDHMGWHLVE
jgi:NAD(P)H-hydrate epimerase